VADYTRAALVRSKLHDVAVIRKKMEQAESLKQPGTQFARGRWRSDETPILDIPYTLALENYFQGEIDKLIAEAKSEMLGV
jgi:hypothetical protein